MTDEEKRQQKALLLLEYQEATDHLANLEEKARRIAEKFAALGKWLDKFTYRDLGDKRPELIAPDLDALVAEINQARARVKDLEGRKTSLGLK